MKIAQITPYFLPHTGGVERYVYNLSKNLVKDGHTIEVFTSNVPQSRDVEFIDGILVRRLKCIGEPLRNPIIPSILLQLEKLKKFDVIHVHNLYSSVALAVPLLKKFCKVPLILTHHGQLIYGEPVKDTCVKIYEKSIEKSILNSVDLSVVLSKSDAQYISSYGINDDKIEILPNAICPADFSNYTNVDTTNFDRIYHLEGKKRVLFVGEVTHRKGIETLIKAIPLLRDKNSPLEGVVFIIVGSGENLSDAKKLVHDLKIEQHVVFTGRLSFFELMQAYRSADLFVLPSISEGLPTSILEAMYFGLPVVSTDIPGVRDHFSNVAMLIPPRDAYALADAIYKLLHDKDLAKYLSQKGKLLVDSCYTWDRVAEAYEALYLNIYDSMFSSSKKYLNSKSISSSSQISNLTVNEKSR